LLQAVGRILKIKVGFKGETLSFEPHHGLNTIRILHLFDEKGKLLISVGVLDNSPAIVGNHKFLHTLRVRVRARI